MKFLILSFAFVGAFAELPRFRPARFRFQRQELAPTTTDSPTEATTEPQAPYPAAGWKPAVPFTLPKQELDTSYGPPAAQNAPYPAAGWKPDLPFTLPNEPPATSYGVPENSYGVPDSSYGAPSTEAADTTTTDNPKAERLEGPVEVQKAMGTYYIWLPTGQLQKVEFATENDVQNMAYTARLQLRDRAPVFFVRP